MYLLSAVDDRPMDARLDCEQAGASRSRLKRQRVAALKRSGSSKMIVCPRLGVGFARSSLRSVLAGELAGYSDAADGAAYERVLRPYFVGMYTNLPASPAGLPVSLGWFMPSVTATSWKSKGLMPSRQATFTAYRSGLERR